jgi:hypothetical protein
MDEVAELHREYEVSVARAQCQRDEALARVEELEVLLRGVEEVAGEMSSDWEWVVEVLRGWRAWRGVEDAGDKDG